MERFAEQDRLEQMNAQKRRLKVAEHVREVDRLIQEKKDMYQAAMVSCLDAGKLASTYCKTREPSCVSSIHSAFCLRRLRRRQRGRSWRSRSGRQS